MGEKQRVRSGQCERIHIYKSHAYFVLNVPQSIAQFLTLKLSVVDIIGCLLVAIVNLQEMIL